METYNVHSELRKLLRTIIPVKPQFLDVNQLMFTMVGMLETYLSDEQLTGLNEYLNNFSLEQYRQENPVTYAQGVDDAFANIITSITNNFYNTIFEPHQGLESSNNIEEKIAEFIKTYILQRSLELRLEPLLYFVGGGQYVNPNYDQMNKEVAERLMQSPEFKSFFPILEHH